MTQEFINMTVSVNDKDNRMVVGKEISSKVMINEEQKLVVVTIAPKREPAEMEDILPHKLKCGLGVKFNLKSGKFSMTFNVTPQQVREVGDNQLMLDFMEAAKAVWGRA